MEDIIYSPIGVFSCSQTSPHESPRQGVLAEQAVGKIILRKDLILDCLRDLSTFERVWLIYDFNKNKSWKPLVQPPRGGGKRGVFATRSPYRPNSIGMSCVKLLSVEKTEIHVVEHDLLDGTPILDIKPYLTYADRFDVASDGWTDGIKKFEVSFVGNVSEKVEWLQQMLQLNLLEIIENQLSYEPTNSKIKRVKKNGETFVFSYKTWRFDFRVRDDLVEVFGLRSGYSSEEIKRSEDQFGDKKVHKMFLERNID